MVGSGGGEPRASEEEPVGGQRAARIENCGVGRIALIKSMYIIFFQSLLSVEESVSFRRRLSLKIASATTLLYR